MTNKYVQLLLAVVILVLASNIEPPNFKDLGEVLMPPMVPRTWAATLPLTQDYFTTLGDQFLDFMTKETFNVSVLREKMSCVLGILALLLIVLIIQVFKVFFRTLYRPNENRKKGQMRKTPHTYTSFPDHQPASRPKRSTRPEKRRSYRRR